MLAAIFYLAKYHPTYLDVEILTQNAALKRACAYLFLQERVFTDLLPNFNATGALSVVKRYFPNISAYSWVDEAENLSHADILKRHENECEKVIIAKEIEATLNEEPNARDSIDVEYKNKLKKIVSTYQHPTLLLRYQNVLFHLLQLEKMHSSETTKTSTTNVKIFYDVPEAIAKLRKHLPKDINDLPSINLKALIPANKIYLLPKTLVTCVENLTAIQKELFNAIAAEEPKKGKKCTML
ncbi:MAG: hypothetical protein NTU49_00200 [Gammaproteobacteria bacterium]|nr:hypothetical protein [Gammaproteobacteria bacterium]